MSNIAEKFSNWLANIGYDKYLHFIAGLLITQIGTALLDSIIAGFAVAVVIGAIKEIMDKYLDGDCNVYDFFATTIGAIVGVILIVIQ